MYILLAFGGALCTLGATGERHLTRAAKSTRGAGRFHIITGVEVVFLVPPLPSAQGASAFNHRKEAGLNRVCRIPKCVIHASSRASRLPSSPLSSASLRVSANHPAKLLVMDSTQYAKGSSVSFVEINEPLVLRGVACIQSDVWTPRVSLCLVFGDPPRGWIRNSLKSFRRGKLNTGGGNYPGNNTHRGVNPSTSTSLRPQ